ncbi:MAG: hypothetical protein WA049_06345 [Ferribacterium limneticum]
MSHFDPTDIQAQERDAEVSADRNRKAADLEIDDLKWLMSNKRGRRFVFRVLERAGVWRLSFNTNALSMAFNEGQRNEGLRLMANITAHCPDRYTEMLEESKKL